MQIPIATHPAGASATPLRRIDLDFAPANASSIAELKSIAAELAAALTAHRQRRELVGSSGSDAVGDAIKLALRKVTAKLAETREPPPPRGRLLEFIGGKFLAASDVG